MKNLHKFKAQQESIFKEYNFSQPMLNTTFLERVKSEYPLALISPLMFKIDQYAQWDYKTCEQYRECEIKLEKSFINEIEKYYPEALI